MERNKIPIWENERDYIPELSFMISSLISRSDRDYQIRVWCLAEGPEVDWYSESSLSFDDEIRFLKHLQKTKKICLDSKQIRAILRVHAMENVFNRIWLEMDDSTATWAERQLQIINHPYWGKIQKQAQHALSLLKKI